MDLDHIADGLAQQYTRKQESRREQLRLAQQRYRNKLKAQQHNARLEQALNDHDLQQRLRRWEEEHLNG